MEKSFKLTTLISNKMLICDLFIYSFYTHVFSSNDLNYIFKLR